MTADHAQLFPAPVEPAPAWAPENTPEKPTWRVTVASEAEVDVFVRAYDIDEARALAREIQSHFVEDSRSARDFLCFPQITATLGPRSVPEYGEPIWDGDGNWEDAP